MWTRGQCPAGPPKCGGLSFKLMDKLTDFGGPETGSTRVIKAKSVSGIVPPLSGYIVVANDNYAFVAANDNAVVGQAIAA